MAADRGDMAGRVLTFDGLDAGWSLPVGEVHVWHASLERSPRVVAGMRRVLAVDELERADRFRFERDRSRYIVGRALLRELLGHYLGAAPEGLGFQYGTYEKPALSSGPWFNLSHSGGTALYAFNATAEIGIDIELDDDRVARDRIAERFFSAAEVSVLRSLPAGEQSRAFLACWTRKEAFIKARGDGLNLALDSFDVTLTPRAELLRTAWCAAEAAQWYMEDLSDRQAGYTAAVALRGNGFHVVKRKIEDTIEGSMPGQEQE